MFTTNYTADIEAFLSITSSRVFSPALSSGVPRPTSSSSQQNRDLSTSGAFKGTGLAAFRHTNNGDNLYLAFQHYTGQIRQLVARDNNAWSGGSGSDVIVGSNARNRTPLASTQYTRDKKFWV